MSSSSDTSKLLPPPITKKNEKSSPKDTLKVSSNPLEDCAPIIQEHLSEKYSIVRHLGNGAFSQVFEAIHLPSEKWVALKIIEPKNIPQARLRLLREATATLRHTYDNLVKTLDFGFIGEYYFLATELIEGSSTEETLQKNGPLPEPLALKIFLKFVEAISNVEKIGLIHRDIKPSNMIIKEQGEVVIIDFGIARNEDLDTITKRGDMLGTPIYFSPEQIRGEKDIDIRTDFYSLGVCLFEMLSGQPPFEGVTSVQVILKHLQYPVPNIKDFAPNVSRKTAELIYNLMAKEKNNRPANTAILKSAVLDAINSQA